MIIQIFPKIHKNTSMSQSSPSTSPTLQQSPLPASISSSPPSPSSPSPSYKIFQQQDFDKLRQCEQKVYYAPLKVMGTFALLYSVYKYGRLGSLLPNPLTPKSTLNTSITPYRRLFKSRANFIAVHTMLFLGFVTFVGAFAAKQINKFKIYVKYRREATYYIRWKVENHIRNNLQ